MSVDVTPLGPGGPTSSERETMKVSFLPRRSIVILAGLFLANVAGAQLSLTVLHSFTGGTDGQQPQAALVQADDGFLYGTTYMGGTNNAGTIFRVSPDGSGNTPIYHFPKNPFNPFGLSDPSGLIQGMDGALYGASGGGGTGQGSVFRINKDGTGFTMLHAFSVAQGGGYQPSAGLVQGRDGNLYGTTVFGGLYGRGTVFAVWTNGSGFAQLHSFGGPGDAQQPMAPLIQGLDGFLYGTTPLGGESAVGGISGFGAVYKIGTNGTEMILHSFLPTGGDGQYPYGGLVQSQEGTLYGVTQQGGSTSVGGGGTGLGTVFKINPDGSGYEILHSFDPAISGDGKYPWPGLVIGRDGALYGTAERGGSNDVGVVFRLNPKGSDYKILYTFGSTPRDGSNPRAPLVRASDGGLFGTAPLGGEMNFGTLFRLAPSPATISLAKSLGDQSLQISLKSAPYFEYQIEASADQAHWVVLTNMYNSTGLMQIADPDALKLPKRFYRAAWVP